MVGTIQAPRTALWTHTWLVQHSIIYASLKGEYKEVILKT